MRSLPVQSDCLPFVEFVAFVLRQNLDSFLAVRLLLLRQRVAFQVRLQNWFDYLLLREVLLEWYVLPRQLFAYFEGKFMDWLMPLGTVGLGRRLELF